MITEQPPHVLPAPSGKGGRGEGNASGTVDALRGLLARRALALGLLEDTASAEAIDAAIETLLDREVRTPEPTDEECSRYYAVHPEEFTSGELVFARHIL